MGRVSHDHALFERAVEANREAEGRRARALLHVTELCGEGRRREVLPWLLPAMRRDQALGRIRLWRLDQAMYGTTRARALRWIRRMRETIGDKSNTKDGYATLDWALHDQKASVRMTEMSNLVNAGDERMSHGMRCPAPWTCSTTISSGS